MIVLDRSSSPIVELLPCKLRDVFFLLLENGSVAMRSRRNFYTVASTPLNPTILSRSISSSSVNNADNMSDLYNPVTEIHYDQKAISDAVRLSKHAKSLTFCLQPCTETNLAVLASDGKIIMIDVKGTCF